MKMYLTKKIVKNGETGEIVYQGYNYHRFLQFFYGIPHAIVSEKRVLCEVPENFDETIKECE